MHVSDRTTQKNPLITLHRLGKIYSEGGSEQVVLKAVEADIHRGEFIAILGRSGSGKSTLLNLIGGLDVPTSGWVAVDDQNISTLSENERTVFRRRHIGFVFQFFNLIPTLSVTENLSLPLELNGVSEDEINTRIDSILKDLRLRDKARYFPDRLSGGEQQRVAIARAVVHQPTLVLADEPTGNLDLQSERDVLQLFRRIPKQHNATLISATHSMEVASGADRILVIEDGTLRALDT